MCKKTEHFGAVSALITLFVLAGIVSALSAADLLVPDRLYSEYENRLLAQKPGFSAEALFSGSYAEDYESYVTDQFIGRDNWISIKTSMDVLLGKKEVNGVYLAKDGTLIEKHASGDVSPETVEKRLELLERLAEWQKEREDGAVLTDGGAGRGGSLRIMLVPTSDNVLTDRLPDYADYYDQRAFLAQVAERISDEYVINVWEILNAHRQEYIYYGTDHHWTTLGASYGYRAWAESMGMTQMSYELETVSEDFYGTLHSRTNLNVEPDVIESCVTGEMQVYYDFSESFRTSLYEESYLETKNQYGYFLDDNHPFVRIETGADSPAAAGRTLFVIKDSYANCLIPFLTGHYETIYVLDLRYYRAGLFPLLEEYDAEGNMDILVLYNVIHFIEEFQYY